MALTNALLKSMGIEGDQRDQIMAEHQATLQSIKDERDELPIIGFAGYSSMGLAYISYDGRNRYI